MTDIRVEVTREDPTVVFLSIIVPSEIFDKLKEAAENQGDDVETYIANEFESAVDQL